MTPAQVHAEYTGLGLDIILSQIEHIPFAGTTTRTSDVNGNEFETFQSELIGMATVNGGPSVPVDLTGPVSIEVFGYSNGQLGTFNTQMLSMDLTGNLPGHSVEIKLDPSNATNGQTTISNAGGGEFNIHSFFDVFTELSLDGGPYIPSTGGAMVTLQPVPEPVGLVALSGLGGMGLIGFVWRRRRAAA